MNRCLIALTALGVALGASNPAQVSAQDEGPMPTTHDNMISLSPISLVFGGFNAEYEKALNGKLTAGIAGGWVEFDSNDHTGVAGLLRYYPQHGVFQGFYLGGRAGVFRKEYTKNDSDKTSSGLGIGLDLGYGWLLGPSQAFYVGLGAGFTHRLTGDSGTFPAASILNVGIAF